MDATYFNEIILRRDLCSWQQAMDLKMKLAYLEDWTRVLFYYLFIYFIFYFLF